MYTAYEPVFLAPDHYPNTDAMPNLITVLITLGCGLGGSRPECRTPNAGPKCRTPGCRTHRAGMPNGVNALSRTEMPHPGMLN